MSDEDLYDEFGNYIGPELESSSDSDSDGSDDDDESSAASNVSSIHDYDNNTENMAMVVDGNNRSTSGDNTTSAPAANAIVLHEDKVHYPSASAVYGDQVKTVVLDEDAMDLETPIVEPIKVQTFSLAQPHETEEDDTTPQGTERHTASTSIQTQLVSNSYLTTLMSNPTTRTRRGVSLVGNLHCGKTSFLDMMIEQQTIKNHPDAFGPRASLESHHNVHSKGGARDTQNVGPPRITDTLTSEQERQLSIKATPLSICLPDTRGKTYMLSMVDCPGHVNFHDESVAGMKLSDGVILMVDAVEGMRMHTRMLLSHAISEGLPLVLVLNKIDRLILELKLPPNDAYYKLLHIIDEVNEYIQSKTNFTGRYQTLSPEKGNVCFASSQHGWSFTCESMAQHYADHNGDVLGNCTVNDFGKRMWGDCYLDPATRTFQKKARDCDSGEGTVQRTFVEFVLEPLYKIYSVCLGENQNDVDKLLRGVGVLLSKEQLRASARPLLRASLKRFFGASTGFVDMIVDHIPSPASAARGKISRCYTGPLDSSVANSMMKCDPRGRLMIHCTKLFAAPDGQSFSAFGRIYSGSVQPGDRVKVLGEAYSPDDDEDMTMATVSSVSIPQGRTRTEVTRAAAGNWVLLDGIDSAISKTATITSVGIEEDEEEDDVQIFAPLKFPEAGGEAVMKLAVEPLNPAELPKMVEGLRRISKSYPMAKTRVEESGEHVLFGTGELYLDCIMHDLRSVYSDIEIKVADPVVGFRETVVETSSLQCFAETPNKRNKLTIIAEPLDDGLAEKIESGKVDLNWDKKKISRFFQKKYSWDLLSSRSVWAFGSSPTHGPNILLDDTLPSEVNKQFLQTCKSSIVQGFQWAVREGPLCEEPVRSTKLKILNATLADKPIHRGGGQIIPTARRTVHSALLTATPKLMEPVYKLEMQCPADVVDALQPMLTKRRGHIVQDRPLVGSTLVNVKAFLPVLDSFGFETDLRTFTQGQAMVHSVFDHWSEVPGDPLDKSIILHPLEPSPHHHLAREFLVKTRRRKGLAEDVSVSKFFDEGMRAQLAQLQVEDGGKLYR